MQPSPCRHHPAAEAVVLPASRVSQERLRAADKQNSQVAVPALGQAAQDCSVTGGYLLRHQPEPGGKVAAFAESGSGSDRRHHDASGDHAKTPGMPINSTVGCAPKWNRLMPSGQPLSDDEIV